MSNETQYTIEVFTKEVPFANHMGDIYLVIMGTDESGTAVTLEKQILTGPFHKSGIEPDDQKVIQFTAPDLAKIESITLGLETNPSDGWHCDKVILKNETQDQAYTFPCDFVLDQDQEPFKIEKTVTPS